MSANLFRSWIKNLGKILQERGPRRSRRPVAKTRPALEILEARVVPATLTPNTTLTLPVTATSIIVNGSGFTNAANDGISFVPDTVTGSVTAATSSTLTVNLTGLSSVTGGTALLATAFVDEIGTNQAQVAETVPVVPAASGNLLANATSMTISGYGFDTTAANDSVSFDNGVSGTVTSASSTLLTVALTGISSVMSGTALHANVTVDGESAGSVEVATVGGTSVLVVTDAGGGAGSSSDVTLPYAVANSLSGGTITFASSLSGHTIDLSGTLTINRNVTIVGLGATSLYVECGYYSSQIFNVPSTVTASISSLTIEYGYASTAGGGGVSNAGTLTLSNDTITSCYASGGAGLGGGGVYNTGHLTISNSTIDYNGGTYGGGIYNTGSLTLSNSTVAHSTSGGGGIYNVGALTLSNSTVAYNSGNGITNTSGGTLTLSNSIVAGNSNSDVSGTIAVANNSLISNAAGFTITGGSATDTIGVSAGLSTTLTNNGGPTQTLALLYPSPALGGGGAVTTLASAITSTSATSITVANAAAIAQTPGSYAITIDQEEMLVTNVNTSTNVLTVVRGYNGTSAETHVNSDGLYLATDQRGVAAPNPPDIGAYQTTVFVVTDPGSGAGSLSDVTLPYAVANAQQGDIITFASSLSGDTITLSSTLTLNGNVSIYGLGAANLAVSGNHGVAVFNIASGVSAGISSLTIENGLGSKGGGIANSGTLTLTNDILSGNTASVNGGGIYNTGSLTLVGDTITGNKALGTGGGIYNTGSLTLTNGTISSNVASGSGSGIVNAADNTLAITSTTTTTISNTIASIDGGNITLNGAGTFNLTGNFYLSTGTLVDYSTTNVTLSGAIGGGGSLFLDAFDYSGTFALTLTGTNTYTGSTTLFGYNATIEIGGSGSLGNGNYAGAIVMGYYSNDYFVYASTVNQTLSGVISNASNGSGVLDMASSSTLTLTGVNTYTGNTIIGLPVGTTNSPAGTLEIGGSGRLGSGTYTGYISIYGTFLYASSANQTLDGAGGYLINMAGPGTLTLGGGGDNGGLNVVVNGGILVLDKAAGPGPHAIGGGNSLIINNGAIVKVSGTSVDSYGDQIYFGAGVLINSGGILDLDGTNVSFDRLTGTGTVTNSGAVSATITLATAGDSSTFAGVIKDGASPVAVTVDSLVGGSPTFSLTGANNYTGATTVVNGTLQISASGILGNGTTSDSAAIDSGATLEFALTSNETYSGSISGSGTLLMASSASLTLSGTSTFIGSTTINSGTLIAGANGVLGTVSAAGIAVNPGGALAFPGGVNYTTAEPISITGTGPAGNGAIENITGANSYDAPITLVGNATLGADAGTLTVASSTVNLTNGSLTTTGSGNVVISSTIEGAAQSFSSQILSYGSSLTAYYPLNDALGSSTVADESSSDYPGTMVNGGVTLGVPGAYPTFGTAAQFNGSGYINANNVTTLGLDSENWTALAWAYIPTSDGTNNSITFFGTPYTTTSGNNLHLITRGGTLYMGFYGNDTASGTPVPLGQWDLVAFTFNNGTQSIYLNGSLVGQSGGHGQLQANGDVAIGDSCCGGVNNGDMQQVAILDTALSSEEIAALYATSGVSVTKDGSGTLTLAHANNTYTGATDINAGTLIATADGAMGPATAGGVNVASGGALAFGNVNYTTAEPITISGSGPAGNGAIVNLSGTSTEYAPITLGANATIGASAGTLTIAATITAGGGFYTVYNAGQNYNLVLTGAGILDVTGNINLGAQGSLTDTASGQDTISGNISGTAGSGTVDGSPVTGLLSVPDLTGDYYTNLTISNSLIQPAAASNPAWLGNLSPASTSALLGPIDFPNIFTDTEGNYYAPGGDQVGARWFGEILIPGAGSTPVAVNFETSSDDGSMLYIDGQTVVSNNGDHGNGTPQTGLVHLIPGYHTIEVDYFQDGGGANMDALWDTTGGTNFVDIPHSAFYTLADVNNVTMSGTGTLILSGSNTYGGSTTVTGGDLIVSSDGNLGYAPTAATPGKIVLNGGTLLASGSFTLNSNRGIAVGSPTTSGSGGEIDVAAAATLTYGGVIANNTGGAGNLTVGSGSNTGTLVLSGTSTYTGSTTLNAGTLEVDGSDAQTSGVTLNSGTTLDGVGTVGPLLVDGGTVNPGNPGSGSGTLTATSANFTDGGALDMEISGATQDLLDVTNALTLGGTSALTVNVNDASTPAGPYTIINDDSASGTFSTFSLLNNPNGYLGLLQYGLAVTLTIAPDVSTGSVVLPVTATLLTISGAGFDSNSAHDSVSFNDGVTGSVTHATSTSLTVALTGLINVTGGSALDAAVTVDGITGATGVEVATTAPVVTTSTAGLLQYDTTMTIAGYGFDTNTANDSVSFTNSGVTGTVTAATGTCLTISLTGLTGVANGTALDASIAVDGASSGSAQQVATVQTSFGVDSVTATPSGLVLLFNAPIDPNTTVLYTTPGDTTYGQADVTLVGASVGSVRGSLIIDQTNPNEATFVQTSGLLQPDTWMLTVTSAVKAIGGYTLSGNFTATLTVATTTTPVVSVPSFARGPGQSVALSNTVGIPISISNATDVTQASFTLTYDPTLLTIAASGAVTPSADAATAGLAVTSYSIINVDAHHSILTVNMSGGTGLNGPDQLVTITASVPTTAVYRNKSVLNVGSVVVNNAPAAGVSGVEVSAYLGDVVGTGVPDATDASLVDQVGSGAGTGFNTFKDLDPSIIAGVDGGLFLNANDASLINEAASGQTIPQIPSVPSGISLTFGGPDPYLYLSAVQGAPGQTVTETLYLDVTDPNGIRLTALEEAIGFDAGALQVSDVRAASGLMGLGSYATASTVDNGSGVFLVAQAFMGTGLPPVVPYGTDVAVLQFNVTLNADVAVGSQTGLTLLQNGTVNGVTQFTAISDNEGALSWTPGKAPSNSGNAAVDGSVTVVTTSAAVVPATQLEASNTAPAVVRATAVEAVRRISPAPKTVVPVAARDGASESAVDTANLAAPPVSAGAAATVDATVSISETPVPVQPVVSVLGNASPVNSPEITPLMSATPNLAKTADPGLSLSVAAVGTNKAVTGSIANPPARPATSALDELYRQFDALLGVSSGNGVIGIGGYGDTDEELTDIWDLESILPE